MCLYSCCPIKVSNESSSRHCVEPVTLTVMGGSLSSQSSVMHTVFPIHEQQKNTRLTLTNGYVHTSPHHCSIIRSNTRLTFRSDSRLKSDSTNGAVGGVRGWRPDVRVSSQSTASNSVGARRFLDFPVDDRGEVQMGGGGGAGITWLGFITAGDGGSSSNREEHRGEGKKLSSLLCCWEA